MTCFAGPMRGENQCQPPVGTSMSTDSEIDLERDRLRHRYRRRDRGGAGDRGLLKGDAWGSSSATLPRVCEWA
jgi:hypothetical protein